MKHDRKNGMKVVLSNGDVMFVPEDKLFLLPTITSNDGTIYDMEYGGTFIEADGRMIMRYSDIPMHIRKALYSRGISDEQIAIMSPKEVFHEYCEWHGLINWSDELWNTVCELKSLGDAADFDL